MKRKSDTSFLRECKRLYFYRTIMYIYNSLLMHQRSNVSTTDKYGFMLITRNVYKYIMYLYLVSNYCEFD